MQTLPMILIALLAIVPVLVFADTGITLDSDKSEYTTGEILLVSGNVVEKNMPIIAMRIYDPDGQILSANNLEINDDNTFSKSITLDSAFYSKSGTYTITFDYGKENHETSFQITDAAESDEIIQEITPEIVSLYAKNPIYYDEEFVEITGSVSNAAVPTVLIGVRDPFGVPAGFYFAPIDSDLSFSTSFQAKSGINFKTDGTYSVIAYFADSEYVAEFDFVTEKIILQEQIDVPTDKPEEPTTESEIETQNDDDVEFIDATNNNDVITAIPKTTSDSDNPQQSNSIVDMPKTQSDKKTETKIIKDITPVKEKSNEKPKPIVADNLSVEDVQLGIMLNNIRLSCDTDPFVDSVLYYDGMGPALMKLCKYGEALLFLDQSLSANPNDIEALTNKGVALNKLGFFEDALYYFDSALEIDSKYIPALTNKANVFANIGQNNDAVSLYNTVLFLSPDDAIAKSNLKKLQNMPLRISLSETLSIDTDDRHTDLVFEENQNEKLELVNHNDQAGFIEQIGVVFSSLFGIFK